MAEKVEKLRACIICGHPLDENTVTLGALGRPLVTVHKGGCESSVRNGMRGARQLGLRFLGILLEKKMPTVYNMMKAAYEEHRDNGE